MKHQVAEILDDIVDRLDLLEERIGARLDRIEANQTITNRTLQEVAQVTALVHDMVRELHARFIELADDHGEQIQRLKKAVGLNGRG